MLSFVYTLTLPWWQTLTSCLRSDSLCPLNQTVERSGYGEKQSQGFGMRAHWSCFAVRAQTLSANLAAVGIWI